MTLLAGSTLLTLGARAEISDADRALVFEREQKRIELAARLAPAVVCVYDENRRGGGSGVLIDSQGHGLTNYHVLAGMMKKRQGFGGLSDGKLYDLDVLGIDPTGDVAMFRLSGREDFPFVSLGDSDRVKIGDAVLALGNPFVLSEDHAPTVTTGIVTGVHRYQWGTGANLIYSDCIQFDASINPGSSGGPLFDAQGEVVGINGRISINTRGRFNVGFGYAITMNQIRRFMPAMRAGLLARHGTLQATVEDIEGSGVVFTELLRNAAGYDAGLRVGDHLLELDRTKIASRNHFASLIGTYPENWPVHLRIERGGFAHEFHARLEPVAPKLAHPFTPDLDVNRRQVESVLRGYRQAVLGNSSAPPRHRAWNTVREFGSHDAAVSRQEKYEGRIAGDFASLRQIHADGSKGRVIEFSDRAAVSRSSTAPDEAPAELPHDQKQVLAAQYLAFQKLLNWSSLDELPETSHVGGDAWVPITWSPGATTTRQSEKERVLDVVRWSLGDQWDVRLGFDAETSFLACITILDLPTRAEVQVDFADWSDVGGIKAPKYVTVRGAGAPFRDELTDWELSP